MIIPSTEYVFTTLLDKNMKEVTAYLEKKKDKVFNDYLNEYRALMNDTDDNLKTFWKTKGEEIVTEFESYTAVPKSKTVKKEELNEKLRHCSILILSANIIEGAVISRCLMELNDGEKLEKIIEDKQIYQFSAIGNINVVHVWPQRISSFTLHGSFNALRKALQRFTPNYVFSVGVAFGADPTSQKLGDVLVADHLVFYDAYNKIVNGNIVLNPDDVQIIGEEITGGCPAIYQKDGPKKNKVGEFSWYTGSMLSGGSVISDPVEKKRLMEAASKIGYTIIGGEMEGSGVYFGCVKDNGIIPCIIIKGICDWAINKNGWAFVNPNKDEIDRIKDCVQAYACKNAFKVLEYIVEQISYVDQDGEDISGRQETKENDQLTFLDYKENAVEAQKRDDYREAVKEWTNAIRKQPNSAEAYNGRGLCYRELKLYSEMLSDYKRAIELEPHKAYAYNNLARYYTDEGKIEECIETLNKAIEADPQYANSYNNRGFSLYTLKDFPGAIADLEKAIELDPTFSLAYKNLGEVYYAKGDYKSAVMYLSKAIQLDGTLLIAYEIRAKAYFSLGEEDKYKADNRIIGELRKRDLPKNAMYLGPVR